MQPEYRKKVEDYVTNDANMEKGHHRYWTYIMINVYENKYKNTEYEKELYRYISHLISREAEKISMRDDKNPKYGITKKESIKLVNLYNDWQFKVKEEKDKKEKAKTEDKGEK